MNKGNDKPKNRGAMQAALGYWSPSVKPRNLMFRQLASALATGGRGMRMPFAQQAEMRSREAGQAALAGADTTLAGLGAGSRSRILNRIGQQNKAATNSIAPTIASRMIASAPDIVTGNAQPINAGFGNLAAGMQQAQQIQAQRLAGYSSAAGSAASGVGSAAGTWFDRYFKNRAPAGGTS